jgi:hypothetical protein
MRTRLSVFLITLSGLILEVGLTRIYSASIWYHFAFVAISVALLGWGLGGFTVHLWKQVKPVSMNAASLVTLLYAAAIPLCLWLLVRYPFEMDRLPLYFLAPLLPFFLAGMALSIIFDLHRTESSSLYFYDLVGAALGAVLVTLLLHVFGGEAALLVGATAPAVAALLISLSPGTGNAKAPAPTSRIIQGVAVITVLLTAGAALSAVKFGAFRVKPGTTKAMRNQMDASPGAKIVQTGWNAYSRARHARLVSGASISTDTECRNNDYRTGWWTRCGGRSCFGQSQSDGSRNEPADAEVCAELRRARRQSVRSP